MCRSVWAVDQGGRNCLEPILPPVLVVSVVDLKCETIRNRVDNRFRAGSRLFYKYWFISLNMRHIIMVLANRAVSGKHK